MGKSITLTIDERQVTVPEGTLIVDAAKMIGIDIPVFCYHPKMEPVGMCRMCLVDIGRPAVDRATGQPQRNEDGSLKIQFGPKLDTACTTPVSEGMVVRGMTEKVAAARKDILEFLLTSHPLDCPICDKGGECPLQNLTLRFGPGVSRFNYSEKMHLAKRVPLGDLIFLDRERCIQCARCVRFQNEIADDPVIGFYHRGRAFEIVSYSEPGFASYFSGNSTDVCPVGALTTTDFRFEARPWEMKAVASVCTQCPVGCDLTLNVRREARSDGKNVIKRVMPRQNEAVNEIWICDKGRWGYHYAQSDERLTQPLVRKDGELAPASWEEAIDLVVDQMRAAGPDLVTLVGGRLANEDLYHIRRVTQQQGGQALLYSAMAGGEWTSRYGLCPGSNIKDLTAGDAILVVACDMEEEAPIWELRIRQAVKRGAALIVVNPRATKLERASKHVLRCGYHEEAAMLEALTPGSIGARSGDDAIRAAAQIFASAKNAVVFYGHEGGSLASTGALAQACAGLLAATGHTGRENNGLVAVWQRANDQGAWELGLRPAPDLAQRVSNAKLLWIAAADPAGDSLDLAQAVSGAGFVVVQDLFLSATARRADIVLPVLPFSEREGSFTNSERRVQRYYPALPQREGARADFAIAALIGNHLGMNLQENSAARVMAEMAQTEPAFAGISYDRLAESPEQWPVIGRQDLYYGGTSYDNHQGVGVTLALLAGTDQNLPPAVLSGGLTLRSGELLGVPVDRLFDHGTTMVPSANLLKTRLAAATATLNPQDAARLGLAAGAQAVVRVDGVSVSAKVIVDASLPVGVVLLPRSVGLPILEPAAVEVAAMMLGNDVD